MRRWIIRGIFLFILLISFLARFEYLVYYKNLPLEPDAAGFFELAKQHQSFYAASYREPFFAFLLRTGRAIFGEKPVIVRLQSFIFSLFLVWFVFYIGKKIFNPWYGLGAAFCVAINPYLILTSVRGLRLELYTTLLLLIVLFLFVEKNLSLNKRLLITGIIGGFLGLTRIESLSILFLLLFYFFLTKNHWVWKEKMFLLGKVTVTFLISLALVAPFLINCKKVYGSYFYGPSVHATFWRDQELAAKKENVAGNYAEDKLLTPYAYIFKMHSLKEIGKRYFQGYVFAFTRYLKHCLKSQQPLLFLGIIGMILLLFSPARFLTISLLIALLPVAFILPLNTVGYQDVDVRFVMYIFPLFSFCIVYCIRFFIEKLLYLHKEYKRKSQMVKKILP